MLKLHKQILECKTPPGMRIFEHDVELECIALHTHQAKRFVAQGRQSIHFECEHHDKSKASLIRVIGTSKRRFLATNECIGYVPADIVRRILDAGLEHKVHAQLRKIYTGDRDHIRITFDLFGPLESYPRYCSADQSPVN